MGDVSIPPRGGPNWVVTFCAYPLAVAFGAKLRSGLSQATQPALPPSRGALPNVLP
jgi:hypothetical protein